jgi:BirA family biotin operon repressor/biotin-[acetyl-CoA-carboxylase] ligase
LYKIPANTLFIGKQVVFVSECHSTNTLALQLSQNPSTVEGTTIITHHQTAGRGQRGNTWITEPGQNLTFSIILKPSFLDIADQFFLNIVISLALCDFLDTKTEGYMIKWPNDILVHGKKICGILIENQVQGSRITAAIAGIGLNVNQAQFALPSATSLKLVVGDDTPLEPAFHELLKQVEGRYLQLRQNQRASLKQQYLARLYRRDEQHTFIAGDRSFDGTIRDVDDAGRLMVETNAGPKYFGVKEISFVQ